MLKYLRMGNKRVKIIWWILVVVTVVTFVGGFIFLFGSGFDTGYSAQMSGALGTVNGEPIHREELQAAITEQRDYYRRRFKAEPGEQEARAIEAQAWRGLVNQHVMAQVAKKLGIGVHDREVLLSLQSSPPQQLIGLPDFQTNGKFDPNKYAQALHNPAINWAPFEEQIREQLPVRKLQERLITALKLSEPELDEAYRRRHERIGLTFVDVPAVSDSQITPPAQADLDRAYQKYKGRFCGPARVRLELLTVPKVFSDEEMRVAREQAQGLADRARRGEDFAQLAKDYSEGQGAEQGGALNRLFQPSEFGPDLEPKMAAMQKGDVSDPIPQPGQFVILKCLDRITDPMSPVPNLRLAQIVIKVHPGENSLRDQFAAVRKLRDRARSIGLAKAATEKGLTTQATSFFPFGGMPPQLYDAPDLADWAFEVKPGAVSQVVEGDDALYVAQLTDTRDAGPAPEKDVVEQLRSIAEGEARVQAARPRADRLMQSLSAGRSLEDAARSVGLTAVRVDTTSRETAESRLRSSPEAVGAAFATPAGRIAGPLETPGGWIVLRVDRRFAPDTTDYQRVKGQLTNEIIQRKQNEFLQAWIASTRRDAKIRDLRRP